MTEIEKLKARIAHLEAIIARVPEAIEDSVVIALANYRGVKLPNRGNLNTSIESLRRECEAIAKGAE